MALQALLAELLEEFSLKIGSIKDEVTRQSHFSSIPNKIKVAIGMRRTGKTYLCFQTIKNLLKKGIPLSRILYINFEDNRLLPLTQKKLSDLLDTFYSLYPENHKELCYFFLDEIQNIEDWALVIRRFFENKNVEIFLTGSSAKLLSKEIATSLRGRSIATEVWPYSFSEFLIAENIHFFNDKILGKIAKDQLSKYLLKYIQEGGFPETIGLTIPDRITLLQDYVNVVLFRDIVERHGISNILLIKYMIKIFLKNAATSLSINKLFNNLKSQGLSVSKATLHEYLSYIEDAFLAFAVPLYSDSLRKVHTNPRKIYAIDTGLINAFSINFSENLGRLFENAIYLELRRRECEVYYYLTENRYEVDFLARDRSNRLHLYQAVWDMSDKKTLDRETRALEEAEKELGIQGTIITRESFEFFLSER